MLNQHIINHLTAHKTEAKANANHPQAERDSCASHKANRYRISDVEDVKAVAILKCTQKTYEYTKTIYDCLLIMTVAWLSFYPLSMLFVTQLFIV